MYRTVRRKAEDRRGASTQTDYLLSYFTIIIAIIITILIILLLIIILVVIIIILVSVVVIHITNIFYSHRLHPFFHHHRHRDCQNYNHKMDDRDGLDTYATLSIHPCSLSTAIIISTSYDHYIFSTVIIDHH